MNFDPKLPNMLIKVIKSITTTSSSDWFQLHGKLSCDRGLIEGVDVDSCWQFS